MSRNPTKQRKGGIMNKYAISVADHRLLSKDEEVELANIIQTTAEDSKEHADALNKLIEFNMKLVVEHAYSYAYRTNTSVDDLIGEGYIGLRIAAEKFNPAKFNNRFSTYAVTWIKQRIRLSITKGLATSIPVNLVSDITRFRRATNEGHDALDRSEVRNKLNMTERRLRSVEQAHNSSYAVSLNHVIQDDSKGSMEISLNDALCDESAPTPLENIIEIETNGLLAKALSSLTEMERDIVLSQCGSEKKETLSQIGIKYHLCAERIRQLRNEVKGKLKLLMNDQYVGKG